MNMSRSLRVEMVLVLNISLNDSLLNSLGDNRFSEGLSYDSLLIDLIHNCGPILSVG